MERLEIIKKRKTISNEIDNLKKATETAKDYETGVALNKKIKELKRQYSFYNKLLKIIGGNK